MTDNMNPEDKALAVLRTVIDPELGVNIVDLGLIYSVAVGQDRSIAVKMTVTSPSCPLGPWLADEVKRALATAFLFAPSIDVQIVMDPPWAPSMMTNVAQAALSGQ